MEWLGRRMGRSIGSYKLIHLQDLALQMMRYAILQEHVRRKVEALVSVDEIEVYLVYETKLADVLNLPVNTRAMRYGAEVTQGDLKCAERAIRSATTDSRAFQQYLMNWAPWQSWLRHQTLEVAWDKLPEAPAQMWHHAETCPLTQEPLPTDRATRDLGGKIRFGPSRGGA